MTKNQTWSGRRWLISISLFILTTAIAQAATGWAVSGIFKLDTRNAPPSPTGVAASDGAFDNKISVVWNAVPGATGYMIYRSSANHTNNATMLATVGGTCQYADSSTAPGTVYYFWVRTKSNDLTSVFSTPDTGWRRSPTSRIIGDFDGDGLADPTIYDASSGAWKIRLSASGYVPLTLNGFLGGQDYVPAVADFDGDGKSDPAVYAEQTGEWIVLLSSAGYSRLQLKALLGGSGWSPCPADYDGDRKAGPAVYHEADGAWKVMLSGSGYWILALPQFLGSPGWSPCPADYDGDGFDDPAIYHEASGDWKILLSGSGYAPVTLSRFLGGPGFLPVSADYDGDGLADPAVHNQVTGEWRIKLSGSGYWLLHTFLQ